MVEILLDELGKPRTLIQHVEDRLGHDRRYCLRRAQDHGVGLGAGLFARRGAAHDRPLVYAQPVVREPIRSGEFRDYAVYGDRKRLA